MPVPISAPSPLSPFDEWVPGRTALQVGIIVAGSFLLVGCCACLAAVVVLRRWHARQTAKSVAASPAASAEGSTTPPYTNNEYQLGLGTAVHAHGAGTILSQERGPRSVVRLSPDDSMESSPYGEQKRALNHSETICAPRPAAHQGQSKRAMPEVLYSI